MVGDYLTASAYASVFVVTWLLHDHHVIIWANQSSADVLRLSPCVNVKLIHDNRGDRKMSMPPDLNMGVAILQQSQSQHGLRSFPLQNYVFSNAFSHIYLAGHQSALLTHLPIDPFASFSHRNLFTSSIQCVTKTYQTNDLSFLRPVLVKQSTFNLLPSTLHYIVKH